MPRRMALVQPEVLRWARESAAYDVETAARRLQVKPERLAEWERGERPPTLRQLRNIANVYRRPFAALFRSEPPPFLTPVADFRRGVVGDTQELSPALAREIRRARFRQRIALDLAEELEEEIPTFSLSIQSDTETSRSAGIIRDFLDVDLRTQKSWPAGRETFNNWRASFERSSVLAFQSADVELDEMRGFSLHANALPVVVVNRKDAHAGKAFTLFHELTHLALGGDGVCDLRGANATEQYCNAVASEALVPSSDFERQPPQPHNESVAWTARTYGVSEEVIWRRLLDHGSITESDYRDKRDELAERFELSRSEERQKRSEHEGGGPSPSRNTVSLAGKYYAGLVLSALGTGGITPADAAEYLGVRAKHFDRVSQEVG